MSGGKVAASSESFFGAKCHLTCSTGFEDHLFWLFGLTCSTCSFASCRGSICFPRDTPRIRRRYGMISLNKHIKARFVSYMSIGQDAEPAESADSPRVKGHVPAAGRCRNPPTFTTGPIGPLAPTASAQPSSLDEVSVCVSFALLCLACVLCCLCVSLSAVLAHVCVSALCVRVVYPP